MEKYEIDAYGHRSYAKRYLQLLRGGPKSKKIGILFEGRFYSGIASEHLTKQGLALSRLRRLRYGRSLP